MSVTREPAFSSDAPGRRAAMTFESLAERLREGPLRTLLTLQVRANVAAGGTDLGDRERLEKLVELAQLSRMGLAQFQDFMLELESLIDHLAAENPGID